MYPPSNSRDGMTFASLDSNDLLVWEIGEIQSADIRSPCGKGMDSFSLTPTML